MFHIKLCENKRDVASLPYQYVAHFDPCFVKQRDYFLAYNEGIIVGMLIFRKETMWHDEGMCLSVLSVLPAFKNKGVAKQLISAFADYVVQQGKKAVVVSSYEPEGKLYLKPLVEWETGYSIHRK